VQKYPQGFEQIAVSSTAIGPTNTKLVSVAGATTEANFALFRVETADVRWRDDGTAPTSSAGTLLKAGEILEYDGALHRIQFIRVSSDASVSAAYYQTSS
jgi:hypothetical protein